MILGISSRSVIKNTLAQLLGKIITVTVTLLITVLVTRKFGPEGYGRLTIMLTFPALFYMAGDFGLNAIFVKQSAASFGRLELSEISNLFGLRLVWGAALAILAALLVNFFPYDENLKIGIMLGLLMIITQVMITSANVIFQLKLAYMRATVALLFGGLATLILSTIPIFLLNDVRLIVFAYFVGGAVTVFVSVFLARSYFGKFFFPRFNLGWSRKIFIAALPLGLTAFLSVTVGKADSLLLSLLGSSSDVGFYGAAYKVFEVCLVLPTFFMNASYPILLKYKSDSTLRFRKAILKLGIFLLVAGAFISFIGSLMSPSLINLIAGKSFAPSIGVLKLLFVGMPVFFITAMMYWLLIILQREKLLPFIYGFACLFNITGNLIFIPRYSFYASAVLTWVTEILILLFCLLVIVLDLARKTNEN